MQIEEGKVEAALDALASGGRVLVSRLRYLGDAILTLPLVELIRVRFPKAEIDYLARGEGAALLRGQPIFARVLELPEGPIGLASSIRLIRLLRRRKYDLAIDLFSNPRSAGLIFLSRARVRIGADRRFRRHLYTHRIRVPEGVRAATLYHQRYLEPLGIAPSDRKPRIVTSRSEKEWARRYLAGRGLVAGRVRVGLHPGGKWEVKRWPVESFARLASNLREKLGAQIVVFSGPGEECYSKKLEAAASEGVVFLPALAIRKVAAILEALDCAVICDGGVMHLSVAVGTPTVGIFGSSEPDVWFPYEKFGPYRSAVFPIDCRPCHKHTCDHLSCLRNLTVEDVEESVRDVLGGRRSSRFSGAVEGGLG